MALVLAFGLTMAVGRYDQRRAAVVDDANAIGTTYLRAQTLHEPIRSESLELLGCYGKGKVKKLAEICAATVLAGDISLTSAILAGDWVTSHDALGRNRP